MVVDLYFVCRCSSGQVLDGGLEGPGLPVFSIDYGVGQIERHEHDVSLEIESGSCLMEKHESWELLEGSYIPRL